MLFRSIVAVALAATACADPTSLTYVNRRSFSPPMAMYGDWWEELEQCSGRRRNMGGIRWFLADWISGGTHVHGQWISNREITFKDGFELEDWVVKHEMLHDLLDGDRDHTHFAWRVCVPAPGGGPEYGSSPPGP